MAFLASGYAAMSLGKLHRELADRRRLKIDFVVGVAVSTAGIGDGVLGCGISGSVVGPLLSA